MPKQLAPSIEIKGYKTKILSKLLKATVKCLVLDLSKTSTSKLAKNHLLAVDEGA